MELLNWLTVTESAWRGQFFDLWTLPHIVTGICIAYIVIRFSSTTKDGFWFALIVAITWEVFEHLSGLSRTEALTNALADIAASQAGYLFGMYLFSLLDSPSVRVIVMQGLGVVYAAIVVLGYSAFKHYG